MKERVKSSFFFHLYRLKVKVKIIQRHCQQILPKILSSIFGDSNLFQIYGHGRNDIVLILDFFFFGGGASNIRNICNTIYLFSVCQMNIFRVNLCGLERHQRQSEYTLKADLLGLTEFNIAALNFVSINQILNLIKYIFLRKM